MVVWSEPFPVKGDRFPVAIVMAKQKRMSNRIFDGSIISRCHGFISVSEVPHIRVSRFCGNES